MNNAASNALMTVVVDDVAIVRERIMRLLDETTCTVLVAEADSVSTALTAVQQHQPDLVLLDLGIPGTKDIPNGVGVLRWIKKQYPSTKVIVLTNYADQGTRNACIREGANAFLDKSSEIEQLLSTLNQMCNKRL